MNKLKRGSMLLETAVACVLLVALAGVCLKSFAAAAAQRLAIDQRQIAIREAANIIEKLTATPWDGLDKAADKSFAVTAQKNCPRNSKARKSRSKSYPRRESPPPNAWRSPSAGKTRTTNGSSPSG